MKLMQFLMGLDDTYMQIRSSILSRENLPDVRSAYAIISSEESHRIATGNFQRSQTSTSFSRPSNNNRPNDNGKRRTAGGSNLVCENYGFNGHTIEKCFKIIRYPVDFRKRKAGSNLKGKNVSNYAVGSSSANGFSDEQMATLISLMKENYVNGKGVHSNMARTYMNSSTSLTNVIDISYLKIKVTYPNRIEDFITKIGNMPLTDYLTLYDGLVVPEYCVSLMSVHKVARDSKLVIAFDEILPTSVLNGKSPYDLVYNKLHSLKHLRSYGCLAYATILNSHDKFGSMSEKDVKFFEDIFPFKQNNSTRIDNSIQDVNHMNFFNTNTLDDLPEIPNDEEKGTPALSGMDADAFTSENGSFAADEENNSNSEGNGLHDQSQDNHWVDAMNAEMDPLYRNNTWEVVDLPVGRKAIGSKWVWKIKYKSDGEIERYKAMLVAKGFNQRERIDFDETFSHVVKIVTIRCLINLVVQNGWSLFQMDINNDFLYGDLEETVYMTLPPGYFPDNETKSKSYYSIFTKSFGDVFIALLVYVDDIIITGNSLTEIEKVKQFLKTKFMIKDLEKLKYFLGIRF
ncbi:ribonuclease H-like domain-containing protein [Tanacetum coccineum]